MKIKKIKTAEPFKSLFPIESRVLDRVQEDMQQHGYDDSQPLTLWKEKGIIVDGHTRLEAAGNLGLEEVPVHEKSFADEDEALAYAVHNQRDRRNLTGADIMRLVKLMDERRRPGERTDLAPSGAKLNDSRRPKSATRTAGAIGVGERTVERTRTIIEHAPPEIKEAVAKGEKSINRAYHET